MSKGMDVTRGTEGLPDEAVRELLVQKVLLAFLEKRVGSRADAEDLLQTAMLRLLTKVHMLRRTDRVLPCFYRMLQNLLIDWHGRRAAAERTLKRLAAGKMPPAYDEPRSVRV